MSNEDFDFRRGFYEISELVACRFPECEITVVDMVRLLCIENDTLRMTIGIPLPKAVLAATGGDGASQ
jgi:hypothetical protein